MKTAVSSAANEPRIVHRGKAKPKPKLSVRAGALTYETKAMPIKRAQAFARMIEANRRFPVASTVIESAGKRGYVVCWLPAATERQIALFERFQSEQWDRAVAEKSRWTFVWTSSTRADITTPDIHEKTGAVKGYNTYSVTGSTCNCPQQQTRCAIAGAFCKHICGLQMET